MTSVDDAVGDDVGSAIRSAVGNAVGFFVGAFEFDVGLGPLLSHEREQCNCVKLMLKEINHIKINKIMSRYKE